MKLTLIATSIYSIPDYVEGNLWLSTNKGLLNYDSLRKTVSPVPKPLGYGYKDFFSGVLPRNIGLCISLLSHFLTTLSDIRIRQFN